MIVRPSSDPIGSTPGIVDSTISTPSRRITSSIVTPIPVYSSSITSAFENRSPPSVKCAPSIVTPTPALCSMIRLTEISAPNTKPPSALICPPTRSGPAIVVSPE